jgi:two-component system, NarL family, invasion response regulator UvrY
MERNVALVDDHHLIRSGLATMVNALGGYRVSIEAGHGKELVEALSAPDALMPAIAVIDLNMPVMDGYATVAWLREHRPEVLPLVLTFDATDDALVKAVRSGARGFLLKNTRPTTFKLALDSIMETGYYYTDGAPHTTGLTAEVRTREERVREGVLARITPRELAFLHLVCDEAEFTYEMIADHMGVHRRTVDNFRISLFEKFNIKSKTGLVLFALRWGLLATPAA